jgi:hypothetical protein
VAASLALLSRVQDCHQDLAHENTAKHMLQAVTSVYKTVAWHHYIIVECRDATFKVELLRDGVRVQGIIADETKDRDRARQRMRRERRRRQFTRYDTAQICEQYGLALLPPVHPSKNLGICCFQQCGLEASPCGGSFFIPNEASNQREFGDK